MTPAGEANEDIGASAEASSSRTPILERAGVRRAIVAAVGLASLAATLLITYELALARMPQHRAALERLVRTQTGLDVRFNELGFRWGWYGPEAVFKRVELARARQRERHPAGAAAHRGLRCVAQRAHRAALARPHHAGRAGYRSREAGEQSPVRGLLGCRASCEGLEAFAAARSSCSAGRRAASIFRVARSSCRASPRLRAP